MKYKKKPVVVDAWQWKKQGDHEKVAPLENASVKIKCSECNEFIGSHGKIKTLEGVFILCPGDFVIKGAKGEFYPVKEDIFHLNYEKCDEDGLTRNDINRLGPHLAQFKK